MSRIDNHGNDTYTLISLLLALLIRTHEPRIEAATPPPPPPVLLERGRQVGCGQPAHSSC